MSVAGDAERRLRVEVAVCTRILSMNGLLGYSGHVCARLPGRSGLLIQSRDDSRSAVAPQELLVCDLDGRLVDGPGGKVPPREVHIHTEILKARPDVQAVCHFHPEIATVFTVVGGMPLVAVKNHASRWADGIPVHPDPGHISDRESGRALAETLGGCNAALIRAHGAVLTAESVPALLADCMHFEENARSLWRAAAIGEVDPLSGDEMQAFTERFDRDVHVAKLWGQALERGLERQVVQEEWLGYMQR